MKKMQMTLVDQETGIKWECSLNDGNAHILKASRDATDSPIEGDFSMPSELGGHPVTSIGDRAFEGCSGLTNVTIPSGVTSIGKGAFSHCSGLTSTTIPLSVKRMGRGVFCGCRRLAKVTISEGVTNIGAAAFMNCSRLTSVMIPSSVTSIGGSAFAGCESLVSMVIPSSVTSIGDWAFEGCSGLMSFIVDEGNPNYKSVNGFLLSKDGKTLVFGINGSVTIPEGVMSIGKGAFSGFESLVSVVMPSSVTSIGDISFRGCCRLKSVTMSEGVTSIGWNAFERCDMLTSITIPKSVVRIGWFAFDRDITASANVDFEGAPPIDLYCACLNTAAAIRYNSEYEDEWQKVIASCGFTNAMPYVPRLKKEV